MTEIVWGWITAIDLFMIGSAGGAAEATGRQRARAAINMDQSPGSGSMMRRSPLGLNLRMSLS